MDPAEHEKLPPFRRAIYWRSTPSFTLYALRPRTAPPPSVDACAWPPSTNLSHFVAEDDDWRGVVDVFDFNCDAWPEKLDELLAGALRQACTGSVQVTWFMFEGGFMDIAEQFSPRLRNCIYGIQLPSTEPKLATSVEEWDATSWRSTIAETRKLFLSLYPEHIGNPQGSEA